MNGSLKLIEIIINLNNMNLNLKTIVSIALQSKNNLISKCRNLCIFNGILKKEYLHLYTRAILSMKCLEDDIDSSQLKHFNYFMYKKHSLKCNALILNGDGVFNHISFLYTSCIVFPIYAFSVCMNFVSFSR